MNTTAEFRIGPDYVIDDHTIIAEGAEIDWSQMSKHVHFGFTGTPIGEILDIKQEGERIVMTARIDSDKLRQIDAELVEFQPAYLVRKMRAEDGRRIIESADLMHVSIGFKYTPEARLSYWERFKAWLRRIIARAKAWLQS